MPGFWIRLLTRTFVPKIPVRFRSTNRMFVSPATVERRSCQTMKTRAYTLEVVVPVTAIFGLAALLTVVSSRTLVPVVSGVAGQPPPAA